MAVHVASGSVNGSLSATHRHTVALRGSQLPSRRMERTLSLTQQPVIGGRQHMGGGGSAEAHGDESPSMLALYNTRARRGASSQLGMTQESSRTITSAGHLGFGLGAAAAILPANRPTTSGAALDTRAASRRASVSSRGSLSRPSSARSRGGDEVALDRAPLGSSIMRCSRPASRESASGASGDEARSGGRLRPRSGVGSGDSGSDPEGVGSVGDSPSRREPGRRARRRNRARMAGGTAAPSKGHELQSQLQMLMDRHQAPPRRRRARRQGAPPRDARKSGAGTGTRGRERGRDRDRQRGTSSSRSQSPAHGAPVTLGYAAHAYSAGINLAGTSAASGSGARGNAGSKHASILKAGSQISSAVTSPRDAPKPRVSPRVRDDGGVHHQRSTSHFHVATTGRHNAPAAGPTRVMASQTWAPAAAYGSAAVHHRNAGRLDGRTAVASGRY